MVLLTKADIINGKEERKDVYIKLLDKEISLKPLTDGEYSHVVAMTKDIGPVQADISESNKEPEFDKVVNKAEQQRKMHMNMDLKKTEEARFKADCACAAYGLSSNKETFQPDDLKNMRPIGVVNEIAAAVIKISRVEDPEKLDEDVKEFRSK